MRPVVALIAITVGAAVAVNAVSLLLHEARLFPEFDGAQILIGLSPVAALLVSLGIGWGDAKSGSSPGQSALTGLAAGVVTFALSWVPALILVALYPPS